MTVLYGSDVADSTLTTACDMATTTGGTEVGKQTVNTGASGLDYMELYSQGSTGISGFTALQSPSGHGWLYKPGAGTFASGNWSASITFQGVSLGTSDLTVRFYKYDGSSTYTSIGTINKTSVVSAKTTYSFAATSMPSVTTLSTDFIYVDLWLHDATGTFGDNPTVYESNSATAGVASDMQITTAAFSSGPTNTTYAFTDSVPIADAFLPGDAFVPIEANNVLDSVFASTMTALQDVVPISDIGTLQAWGIDALSASDSFASTETGLLVEANTASDSVLASTSVSLTDTLLGSDTFMQAGPYTAIETTPGSDSQFNTATGIGIEALSIVDVPLLAGVYEPIDVASVADTALMADTANLVESAPASDFGNLQSWGVDALTAIDSITWTETSAFTDTNTVSESWLDTSVTLFTEGLAGSESVTFALESAFTDETSVADIALAQDDYSVSDTVVARDGMSSSEGYQSVEILSVADTFFEQASAVFLEHNSVNDVYLPGLAFVPVDGSLIASDAASYVGLWLPTELLSALDMVLATDTIAWTESAPLFDASLQNPTFVSVDALIPSDSMQVIGHLVPIEALSILDPFLAGDMASWTEVLLPSDLLELLQTLPQHILPVVLAALFRDGTLIAHFRDGVTPTMSRDGVLVATFRDGIVTAIERDGIITAEYR